MNDELGKCCFNHRYKLKTKCPPIFLWVGQIGTSPGADYIDMIHYELKRGKNCNLAGQCSACLKFSRAKYVRRKSGVKQIS